MVERRISKLVKRGVTAILITAASYMMPEVDIPRTNLFNRADAAVGNLEPEPAILIADRTRIYDQLYYESWKSKVVLGQTDAITAQEFVRLVGSKDSTVPKQLILWTEISKKGPIEVCVETYKKPQTCEPMGSNEESFPPYPFYTESLKEPGDYIVVDSGRVKAKGTGEIDITMKVTDEQGTGLLTSAKTTLILLDRQVNLPAIRKGVSLDPQTYFPYLQTFNLWERRQQRKAA